MITPTPHPRAARERYEAARRTLEALQTRREIAELAESHGEFRSAAWWAASDAALLDADAALKRAEGARR